MGIIDANNRDPIGEVNILFMIGNKCSIIWVENDLNNIINK